LTHLEIFEVLKGGNKLIKRNARYDTIYKMENGYIYTKSILHGNSLISTKKGDIWFRVENINFSGKFEIIEY